MKNHHSLTKLKKKKTCYILSIDSNFKHHNPTIPKYCYNATSFILAFSFKKIATFHIRENLYSTEMHD